MKPILVLFAASVLSLSFGCVTQGHRGSQVASMSNDTDLPSTFNWDFERPGKSSSNTHVIITRDGNNFVVTSQTDYVTFNIGGGHSTVSFDTAKKTASTVDSERSATYDGNSRDPEQIKGYNDAINSVISDLGTVIGSVDAGKLLQRDAIVAQLRALPPPASVASRR